MCTLKYLNSSGTAYYQFMLRTLEDVKLDQPQINLATIFNEPFDTNFLTGLNKIVLVGTTAWNVQATFGNPTF